MILYKFRAFEDREYTLDILRNERLYCSNYRDLNDPFEGMFMAHEVEVDTDRDSASWVHNSYSLEHYLGSSERPPRVCSLSANPFEIMMWGLYANSSKGIAIEFDIPDDHIPAPKKVHYSEEYPYHRDEWYDNEGNLVEVALDTNEVLTHKTTRWEYEAEYRILQENEYFDASGMISRVILGPKADAEIETSVERDLPESAEIEYADFDFNFEIARFEPHPSYENYHDHWPCDEEDFYG